MVLWKLFPLFLALWSVEVMGEKCPAAYRRFSSHHTFCLEANSSCHIKNTKVSSKDIEDILKEHNTYRSRVATGNETTYDLPKASNMLQMVWDDELAAIAQKHSEQCKFQHDCSECRRVKNFGVGQNLYETVLIGGTSLPKANWHPAVKSWYDEVKDFDKQYLREFQNVEGSPATGHFTQVIWADSWRVGCGYTLYEKNKALVQLYTCNYGPGGNFINEPLYKQGEPCTQCPLNSRCGNSLEEDDDGAAYPGLCKIIGDSGPQYALPSNLIFQCRFNGESYCARVTTPNRKEWKVTNTLSGSYIGIVLNPGESSTLSFTVPFKGEDSMCFTSFYRKGPAVAGEKGANEAQEIFTIPEHNFSTTANLISDAVQPVKFDMQLNWGMETKFAVRFSVPKGSSSQQYFEISNITAKEGEC